MASKSSSLKPNDADLIEGGLKVLSPRWTAAILLQLSSRKRRTKHLLHALPKLSAKVFSDRVRTLEKHGLVQRESFPKAVEYSLTGKGREVLAVLARVKEVTSKLTGSTQKTVETESETGSLKVKRRK